MTKNYNIGTLVEYEYGGEEEAIILNFNENIYKLIALNQYKILIREFKKEFLEDSIIKNTDIKELTEQEIAYIIYKMEFFNQSNELSVIELKNLKTIHDFLVEQIKKLYPINTIIRFKTRHNEIGIVSNITKDSYIIQYISSPYPDNTGKTPYLIERFLMYWEKISEKELSKELIQIINSKSNNLDIISNKNQGEDNMENYNYQLNLLTTNTNTKIDELKSNINEINEIVLKLNEQNIKLKDKIESDKNELNIGNIQALKVFENTKDFINKTRELFRVNNWHIQEGNYTDRANVLKKFSYFTTLKNEFNEKNLTNRPITDEQLVSFFDTMSLMYKILTQITDEKIKQEMKIIMEYVIPDPSKPRIDYMLIYRNSIYLLEFSKATSINTLSNESSKKLQQINGYATMLKTNINNNNIKINIALGMYLDESSEENIETTSKTIDAIKKKINKTFKNEELKNAFEILTEME